MLRNISIAVRYLLLYSEGSTFAALNDIGMNKAYTYIIGILVVVMGFTIAILWDSKDSLEKKWKDAVGNVKSYEQQFSSAENKNRAFKLTIDQLKDSNDSIFVELNATRKELKIKDSKLKSLQYVGSDFSKVDTIRIPGDTIFKDTNLNIDTLLADEWYSVKVGLEYPSTVVVQPKFKSEKHIVVSAKRETVNPPKRFFLWRLFQKKQWVMQVDVVEKNPYVQNQTNRHVEIVR